MTFLVDQELLGSRRTGLDLIEELKIGDRAILVTSHEQTESMMNRVNRNRIKFLPKTLARYIPIEVKSSPG